MSFFQVSPAHLEDFQRDGYILIPKLLGTEELVLLDKIARADARLAASATDRRDAQGAQTRLALRNELADDYYSAIIRSRRVVDTMELLLADEVYHYHHKMMLKEPRVGGAWEWHQDYGYWYNFGCLFPDMASCFIAIDRATRENGCLQVIRGSHRLGRIDHGKVGDQTGADPQRVAVALQRLEHRYVEMEPGTGLFFHANLLHRSDQNHSDRPRWSLIACYNTRHNDPYCAGRHPNYQPLEKLDDGLVLATGQRQWDALHASGIAASGK